MQYTRLIGTGSYFPKNILTNFDMMKIVDTSDEWIVERTGIRSRHIAGEEETIVSMGYEAAKNAIDMAGIDTSEIDGVILSTLTPDYAMPVSSVEISHKLGLKGPFAFDMNMACSGYLYALKLADGLIRSGSYKTLLIITSEKISSVIDYKDRSTCILFGDGAGATVLRADNTPGLYAANIHADGSYGTLLTLHGSGNVYMSHRDSMKAEENLIKMNGNETFKLAVRNMSDVSVQTLKDSGLNPEDIDYLVPHQANIRIIDAIAKRFNIDMDKVLINLDRRGNCSSATIPAVLDEGLRSGKLKNGNNILMTAFGGGMGWGAAVMKI